MSKTGWLLFLSLLLMVQAAWWLVLRGQFDEPFWANSPFHEHALPIVGARGWAMLDALAPNGAPPLAVRAARPHEACRAYFERVACAGRAEVLDGVASLPLAELSTDKTALWSEVRALCVGCGQLERENALVTVAMTGEEGEEPPRVLWLSHPARLWRAGGGGEDDEGSREARMVHVFRGCGARFPQMRTDLWLRAGYATHCLSLLGPPRVPVLFLARESHVPTVRPWVPAAQLSLSEWQVCPEARMRLRPPTRRPSQAARVLAALFGAQDAPPEVEISTPQPPSPPTLRHVASADSERQWQRWRRAARAAAGVTVDLQSSLTERDEDELLQARWLVMRKDEEVQGLVTVRRLSASALSISSFLCMDVPERQRAGVARLALLESARLFGAAQLAAQLETLWLAGQDAGSDWLRANASWVFGQLVAARSEERELALYCALATPEESAAVMEASRCCCWLDGSVLAGMLVSSPSREIGSRPTGETPETTTNDPP